MILVFVWLIQGLKDESELDVLGLMSRLSGDESDRIKAIPSKAYFSANNDKPLDAYFEVC